MSNVTIPTNNHLAAVEAAQAEINHGLPNVVSLRDIGKFELLRALPVVYNGSYITHPKVSVEKANKRLSQLLTKLQGGR